MSVLRRITSASVVRFTCIDDIARQRRAECTDVLSDAGKARQSIEGADVRQEDRQNEDDDAHLDKGGPVLLSCSVAHAALSKIGSHGAGETTEAFS